MASRALALTALLSSLLAVQRARADPLPHLSIAKEEGQAELVLGDHWLTTGRVEASPDGVVLIAAEAQGGAPDAAVSVFSSSAQNMQEGSIFVKLRVQGGGGDSGGVSSTGIWLTREVAQVGQGQGQGSSSRKFAGNAPSFVGVGVIVKLCRGCADDGDASITVAINPDGARSEKDIEDYGATCKINAAALPQGSEAFDFSLKIMTFQGMLFVLHDVTNQNLFAECVTQPLDGAHDVFLSAYLGVTAQAGGASPVQGITLVHAKANTRWDHDPGVVVHESPAEQAAREAGGSGEAGQQAGGGEAGGAGVDDPNFHAHGAAAKMNIDEELSKLQLHEWASEQRLAKLESTLHEQLETRLDTLEQSLKSSMGAKLNERIAALENKIKNAAETALVERIAHLEQQFKNDVENKLMGRVEGLEDKLRNQIDAAKSTTMATVADTLTERLTTLEGAMKVACLLAGAFSYFYLYSQLTPPTRFPLSHFSTFA
jgi:hypothetical protein